MGTAFVRTRSGSRYALPRASLPMLPDELLLQITAYCGPSEWRSLCATHPLIRGVGEQLLYESIHVTKKGKDIPTKHRRILALSRTLCDRPELASLVQTLAMNIECSTETDYCTEIIQRDELDSLPQLLNRLHNLRFLELGGIEYSRLWMLPHVLEAQNLPHLRHLDIDGEVLSPSWFTFPNLESLEIGPAWRPTSTCENGQASTSINSLTWTVSDVWTDTADAIFHYDHAARAGPASFIANFPGIRTLRLLLRTRYEHHGRRIQCIGTINRRTIYFGSFDILLGISTISDETAAMITCLEVRLESNEHVADLEWTQPLHALQVPNSNILTRFSALEYLTIPERAFIQQIFFYALPTSLFPRSLRRLCILYASEYIKNFIADIAVNRDLLPNIAEVEVHFSRRLTVDWWGVEGGKWDDLGAQLSAVGIELSVYWRGHKRSFTTAA